MQPNAYKSAPEERVAKRMAARLRKISFKLVKRGAYAILAYNEVTDAYCQTSAIGQRLSRILSNHILGYWTGRGGRSEPPERLIHVKYDGARSPYRLGHATLGVSRVRRAAPQRTC